MVALVLLGMALGYAVAIFSVKPSKHDVNALPVQVTEPAEGTCSVVPPSTQVDLNALSKKLETFLDKSFLEAQGLHAKVVSIKPYKDSNEMFEAEVVAYKGDTNVGSDIIYITSQGYVFIVFQGPYDVENPLKLSEPPAQPEIPKSERPKVLMFVMSFCPFGQQAERGLKPVMELLGDKLDFEPHYVIYDKRYGYTWPDYCIDENAEYCSMHGVEELKEDVRQLCIWKYHPDKFWNYVSYINANCSVSNVGDCWKDAAASVDLNVEAVQKCFDEEALTLLAKEKELNERYGVSGSPTIFINDTEYSGGRTAAAFQQAICDAFENPPADCNAQVGDEGETSQPPAGSCG
jgi:glutaredoxin